MADAYVPPPPPYEASQQEFDTKISHALEVSLSLSDNQRQRQNHADEQWEEWDEAAFEAAFEVARRQRESQTGESNAGSSNEKRDRSGSQGGVQPLRILKRSDSAPKPKERPNWYEEANLGQASSSHSQRGSGSSSGGSSAPHHQVPSDDEEEDHTLAPPPFEPVGPNLDGPPFEEVVLAYTSGASAPPSPLTSPQPTHSPLPSRRDSQYRSPRSSPHPERPVSSWSPQPQQPNSHYSTPPPARRGPHYMGPRPATSYAPTKPVNQPHMGFDPAVAYTGKPAGVPIPASRPAEVRNVNATAFYNSAVSAHFAPNTPRPAPRVNPSYQQNPATRHNSYPTNQQFSQPGNPFPSNTPIHSMDSGQPSWSPHYNSYQSPTHPSQIPASQNVYPQYYSTPR